MRNAQPQRAKTRVLIAVLVVCLLVTTASLASAEHSTVDGFPRAETYTDLNPDWTSDGDWTREGHNCGFWGCGDHFWVTKARGARAEWYLPYIQGVYTFGRTLGKHFTPEKYLATGTIKWTIWEWRKGSNSYRKIRTFTPPSQRDRLGWWTYNNTRIELNGAVKIRAEVLESGKRVGVQHVRLNHVGVLPEHETAVRTICLTHGLGKDKQVSDFLERHSLKSRLLGDEVDLEIGGLEEGTRRSVIRNLAYEALIKATVRILHEVNASGAQARAERIEEQCEKNGGSWHYTGLGWTYYEGWGHAARLLAGTLGGSLPSRNGGCVSITLGGGLNTGCLYEMR